MPRSLFLNIHFIAFMSSTPMSSQLHLSFRFSHQNPVCMYFVPHTCYLSCPYNSHVFGQPNLVRTENYEAPHYGIFSILLSLYACILCPIRAICPALIILLYSDNQIWYGLKTMKPPIMEFSPFSCHFLSLRTNYLS